MDAKLVEANEKAKKDGQKFAKRRFVYATIERHMTERIFIGLIGPRGVGKTVLLKQLLLVSETSFYVSLDNAKLDSGLYELAKELSGKGVTTLLIDEIHMIPRFEKELKNIFDSLDINIIFTSSCALSLYETAYDLSRRIRTINVLPLSFREYIWFKKDELPEPILFDDLFNLAKSRKHYGMCLKFEPLFDEYLRGESYLFAIGKSNVLELYKNILTTIISRDIFYAESVGPVEQLEIERMLRFIGNAPAEDISYSAIANALSISKYKAEKYVSIMEKAFVLKTIWPKGTNILKEPKILFVPPYRLLYKKFEDCIGALREDFFVESATARGMEIFYLKTNRGRKTPDYLIENSVVEIGGIGKGREQFKGMKYKQKVILTHPGTIDDTRKPLFFFGMA